MREKRSGKGGKFSEWEGIYDREFRSETTNRDILKKGYGKKYFRGKRWKNKIK